MYQAKHRGVRHTRYDPGQDPHSLARLSLMSDLRHATERNELSLHYQPKIDVRTQRVVGVEALLRWQHPRHGMVPPDTFIAQAEQTGIIKPLTDWILNEALCQCAEWNAAGMPLSVAVNLSARVLQDPQLPRQVAAMLERHAVGADQLELEITETAIMSDPVRATQVLTELDAMGVHLSIDDFGTGYTSLAQLKRLPVDEVKIDRSFVLNMLRDANDAMIVQSIVDLAHNMNRSVVAEGVESKKILDALADLGCDIAQGYYFSKPIPASALRQWLMTAPTQLASDNSGALINTRYSV
jgi:EAL domain-containing protein (putative c-di-GMP-specific phosphodiesterase class I)